MKPVKCKSCGEVINLTIWGNTQEDICWGCLTTEQQDKVIDKAVSAKKSKNRDTDGWETENV